MTDDIFDFGFTAVTEEELDSVQTLQPLLNNLRKDPEKEYILWPNRLEKVEQFSDLLDSIYKGE